MTETSRRIETNQQTTAGSPDRLPLTAAQLGIWYAQQLDPENPSYQIGQYLDLRGQVDEGLLRIAFTKTVADLDAMSLVLAEDGDGPYAVLERPSPTADLLTASDLRRLGEEEAVRVARERMDLELETPRSMTGGDLLGTTLYRVAEERWLLFQRVHHVLLDGYSAVVGLRYLAGAYTRLEKSAPRGVLGTLLSGPIAHLAARSASPLPGLHELHEHLDEYASSEKHEADADYWRAQLADDSVVTGLEGTTGRAAKRVVRVSTSIPEADAARLRALGRDLPKTAVGLVALYLSKMTGQARVSLGLPVTARRGKVAKTTPSMLSSILPLRVDVSAGLSLSEVIANAGDAVRGAVAHQQFRVEEVAQTHALAGPSVNLLPVIDELVFGRARGTVNILSTGPVHDLSVVISGLTSEAAAPTLQLEGDAELYTSDVLREHAWRMLELLSQVLDEPATTTVTDANVVRADEIAGLLEQGSGDDVPIGQESVLRAFSKVAAVRDAETAVVAADGTLTFAELDALSTRLAHHLVGEGVGAGRTVAVRIERSRHLPVLVLAVLKAGGVYVPLDPEYPIDRVGNMIEDAQPALLLTSKAQEQRDLAAGAQWRVATLPIDADTSVAWRRKTADLSGLPTVAPSELAYVVFTSGSTGRPKGVGVDRLALRNLFEHHRAEIFDPAAERLGRPARVAHTAGLSFDAAWDPLLWLFAGHELHMIDDDVRRDPQRLAAYFAEHGIDAIETTPSFAEALIAGGLFDQDRYPTEIALGGEAVGPALWDVLAAQPDVRALNLYGPTETTVDSLIAPIESGSEPHIGTSVRNTRHYLLDASLTPVPDGAIGELYLAGANVASGYVGQPGLSAERFLADPFAGDGTRMYRTGDVVRRRRSGSLRFLGRIDEQIKIRGYRVELAEVEAALRRQPGVSAAAAIVVGEGASARLVGYVTGDSEITDLAARTRASLATELPGYMVPSSVLALSELPMTPNGKLDRRALPAPDQAPSDPVQQPRTRAERVTAEAFADVLGITSIGVDEDFFAAGGHSLLATKLASKLSERLERQVTVRDVFERPTVAGLASLDAEDADAARTLPLVPTPHTDELPVSLAQRRLWFLNSLEPGSSAYNIPVVLHLDGELDVAALRWAFRDVAERHEPLRTVFPYIDGEPRQRILPIDEGAPSFTAVEVPADRVDEIVRQESLRPFDVTVEVPLRAVLLRRSATSHVLVATMHHIASDGWSLAPFAADLSAAYTARTAPESAGSSAAPSPALPVSYADYTLWQRESLGSEEDSTSAMSTQLDFWRRALAGAPDEIDLPRDRERGSRPSDIGHLAFELDAERHLALRRVASEHRTSLFIVLHAAVAAALGQHGAGTDIVLGTPVAGRVDPKLERLVGFFVNTVALRTSLVGNPTLEELIERVRAGNTDAYAHQGVPFDAVVDAVRPARVADRHPVFQVLLTLQNTEPARLDLGDVEVTVPGQVTTAGVKTDLMLDFSTPAGDEGPLEAALAYDLALFDESTIERMRDTVDRMLAAMVESVERPLSEIPAVDAATRHRIDTQARGRSLTVEGTVLDVLAASIRRAPQASALEDEHEHLSFAELGARVDAAALGLVASGVRPGDRVAVALPRSVDAVTLVLAALRSGAIAVPIDIDYPDARIAQILEASTPALLVASDADRLAALAADSGTPAASPAALVALGESAEDTSLPELPRPEQPAYLVFTSGTTGTPKGVQVPHSALANVQAQHEDAMIAPLRSRLDGRAPRVLHVAGLGFDAAWDPILWLAAGSTLVMATDGTRRSADELVQRVDDAAIDVLETTPSYVRQLISTGLLDRAAHRETPLLIALGGEAVSRELWDSLLAAVGVEAWNLYGPSEFAVDSVVTRISEPGHVRIGRPVANVTARVLDAFLRDVPDGVPGELHLAGASEAHGYRGRAAETATAFIADPSGNGTRLYRTGDIVRRHGSGELEFLRRDDDQIKLRGYRIELGDVERSLERTAGVDAAVATIHAPAGQDSARLVAWVAGTADARTVTAHARAALPDYMVPSSVTVLERLPLTPNGKVDLAALPAPESAAGSRRPQTEDERAICAAFAAVIGLDEVGLDDDFFRLGGHSLLAVALAGELRTRFGTAPALRAIFDAPTPAGLLALLGRTGERTEDAHMVVSSTRPPLREWTAANPRVAGQPLPLSPGQARLWFLNRLAPSSGDYNVVLSARLDGELDREALVGALDDLVARHEVLRTSYPEADGAPVQRIHAPVSGLLQSEPVDASAGFDLTRDLPFRAGLSEQGDGSWLLQLVIHHIATDGASLAPLAHDLATAYTARRSGSAALRRPLPAQFADFARLLTAHEDEAREARELTAWTDFLDGAPSVLELSADGAREAGSAQPARQLAFTVPANVATGLGSVAAGTSASGFHGWVGALAGFLMRTGSGTDLVIGAPSAGRQDADLSDLIGFFVNTLPLRIQLGDDTTLAGAVEAARASALFGIDHEQVPFERIVEAVAPERVLGRHPLFQTMLAVEEQSDLPLALPGVDVSPVAPESTGGAKFDLSFTLRPAEAGSDVPGVLEYNSALFSEAAANGLVERLLAFLTVATETPDAPLASITIPGTPERLPAWRPDGDAAADADLRSVLEAFDAAAERTPDAPAVVAPDGAVDFRTLAERTEQVSLALRRSGVKRGGVVAYRLPRSIDTVAALLGIWRAGAVAMPIDPEYPNERVDAMLDAARPALVIDGGLDEILAEGAGAGGEAGKTGGSEVRTAQLDAPAYLIFTSGTTGVPKGVQVPHRALASLLRSHRSTLLPDAAERRIRVAHTTGVGFDAAMDPILWLASGHELHVIADDVRRDPEALVQLFADRQIRAWETTPSYVEALTAQTGLEHWLDSLSAADSFTLLLGGEAISGELWTWLRRRTSTRAWNLYGPTEVGVDSMLASIEDTKEPTLGSTTRDVVGHVLDARLRPAPAGSIGELWLSGRQLADGYTGRSAATAERFVADPFARDGSRMYRTGDLVVVRDAMPDEPSRVVSLGRTDAQLKIRGHRVEPEELTRVISEQPGVASAVVLPVESAGQTVLGAWIVPSELPAESDDTAREQLADQVLAAVRGRVPDYMHPVGIRVIARIPLTPNGKLDRDALPEQQASGGTGRAPSTRAELAVAAAFAETLGVDDVRADDSFFALGGHSFVAQPTIRAINDALGTELPVQAIFQAPSVEGLAALASDGGGDIAESLRMILPLRQARDADGSTAGQEPLFAVHPASGISWKFAGLLAHLEGSRPLYGLQLPGIAPDVDHEFEHSSLEELLDAYVKAMRSVQPEGPYRIVGWSFGGRLAHHLAAHLQRGGDEVELLAIIDAYPTEHSSVAGVDGGDRMWRAFLDANEVAAPAGELDAEAVRAVLAEAGNPLADIPARSIDRMVRGFLRVGALLDTTPIPTFEGGLHVFEARVDVPADRPAPQAWAAHATGRVTSSGVQARHSALLDDASLRVIAPVLDTLMSDSHAQLANR